MNAFMHSDYTDTVITRIDYSVSEIKRNVKQTEGGLTKTLVGFGIW